MLSKYQQTKPLSCSLAIRRGRATKCPGPTLIDSALASFASSSSQSTLMVNTVFQPNTKGTKQVRKCCAGHFGAWPTHYISLLQLISFLLVITLRVSSYNLTATTTSITVTLDDARVISVSFVGKDGAIFE